MKSLIVLILAACAACSAQDVKPEPGKIDNNCIGYQGLILCGNDAILDAQIDTRWDAHEEGGVTVYQLFVKHKLVATIKKLKVDGLISVFAKEGIETFDDLDAAKAEAEKLFAAEHADQDDTTPTVSFPGEFAGSTITITGPFDTGVVMGAEPGGNWSCAYWDKQGGWGCNEKPSSKLEHYKEICNVYPTLIGCPGTMTSSGIIAAPSKTDAAVPFGSNCAILSDWTVVCDQSDDPKKAKKPSYHPADPDQIPHLTARIQ